MRPSALQHDFWSAARVGDLAALARLAPSVDVNAPHALEGGYRQPALFVAALNGHAEAVRAMVLVHGADPSCCDSDGESLCGYLGKHGLDEMAQLVHELVTIGPAMWKARMAQAVLAERAQEELPDRDGPPPTAAGGATHALPPPDARSPRVLPAVAPLLRDLTAQLQHVLAAKTDLARRRAALQQDELELDAELAKIGAQLELLMRMDASSRHQ